jgi:hypothetical protein
MSRELCNYTIKKLAEKEQRKKEIKDMKSGIVSMVKAVEGLKTSILPREGMAHHFSAWEPAVAWANRETLEETLVITTTLLVVGSLFLSFCQSLL